MNSSSTRKTLFLSIIFLGFVVRTLIAAKYQTRVWVDEVHVVLSPAYKLLTGVGPTEQYWTAQVRDYLPPSALYLALKFLKVLGMSKGSSILLIVRSGIALMTTISIVAFTSILKKLFALKTEAWLAALLMLFTPEFIHYGASSDLSVIGLPLLLLGTALLFASEKLDYKFRLGAVLTALSALIRFQFGVFPAVYLIGFLFKKKFRPAIELSLIGIAALLIDFSFNTKMYGNPVLPIWNYFHMNTVGGEPSLYGVTPFYFGFELLWRFMTEPVFLISLLFLPLALKKAPALTCAVYLFYILHLIVPHKEYRFFYGAAVTMSGLSAAALQKWTEGKKNSNKALLLFLFLFGAVSIYRSTKVDFRAFEIPAKLETLAGEQTDIKGLITFGWGGIFQGCNYVFHQPLPCVFAENLEQLKDKKLDPNQFSHIVAPSNLPAPCSRLIKAERGGSLYSCTTDELAKLIIK